MQRFIDLTGMRGPKRKLTALEEYERIEREQFVLDCCWSIALGLVITATLILVAVLVHFSK